MLSRLNQRISGGLAFPALPILIIGFGIYIRIVQYLHNRALWADEAALTLNILNRSYLELFLPLDNEQGAPIGFLLVERLMVQLLGSSEFALRLFPLICGIGSLFLLYILAKRLLLPSAVPIVLWLAASSDRLIYYSSEVKQYSTDVTIALALTLFLLSIREQLYRPRAVALTAAVGSMAIWWSHPAIFVLAGVELAFILTDLLQRKKLYVLGKLPIYGAWLLSFVAFYLFSLQRLSNNDVLLTSWTGRGLPPSPLDLGWSIRALSEYFYNPVGFVGAFKAIAILAALMGCISWFRRKPETLLLMVLPIAVTLFASYLDKYPFNGRLILFLYPFAAMAIAEGFEFMRLGLKPKLFAPLAIAMA
ncbi:MAG TPA: glycosyltransferase family 39 protein, partial [Chroococcidiopsis sp.]